MKRNKIKCEKCNREISKSNFNKHKCIIKNKYSENYEIINNEIKCNFCKKIYSKHGIINHISITHLKERKNSTSNKEPWNKGQTKETNVLVKQASLKIKAKWGTDSEYRDKVTTNNKLFWTDEQRKRKSEEKILLYKNFPEKHPNRKLAGNKNKCSYPEKLCIDFLIENKIKFKHQEKIGKYFPDFILYENIIIEVDGEYWHKNKEYDSIKDEFYLKCGYKIFRIKAKNVIQNLKNILFQIENEKVRS
jgi:very-short-patch-repair endonuclease